MPKVAKPPKAAASTKPKAVQQMRDYTVVRVEDDGGLTIADQKVPARRQEEACDLVVNRLPEQERSGRFAAFLAGSYRDFEYVTEQKWTTTKKPRVNGAEPNPLAEPTPINQEMT